MSGCLSHAWGGFSVSPLSIQVKSKVPLLLFCPQSQEIEGLCLNLEGSWVLGSWSPIVTDLHQNTSGLQSVFHVPRPKLLPVCSMIPTTSWREH